MPVLRMRIRITRPRIRMRISGLANDFQKGTRASIDFHTRRGYEIVGTFHRCGYKFDTWYDVVGMETVSYTHLDVYKRQDRTLCAGVLPSV